MSLAKNCYQLFASELTNSDNSTGFLMLELLVCISTVIAQEKTMQNIEEFDKHKLKHAETQEKSSLPDQSGNHLFWHYSVVMLHC